MSRPISKSQIRAIKCRQRGMGLDDDTYRGMLRERYGVESCTRLTMAEGHDLINHLYGGPKPTKRRRVRKPAETPPAGDGNVVSLPSPLQQKLIGALANEIEWETEDGYRRWLKRLLGLDRVRSARDASRVIEGLKGLKRHGHGARA